MRIGLAFKRLGNVAGLISSFGLCVLSAPPLSGGHWDHTYLMIGVALSLFFIATTLLDV